MIEHDETGKERIKKMIDTAHALCACALALCCLAAEAACPKCGGIGKVPVFAACTNSCRNGYRITSIRFYDERLKRRRTRTESEPCECLDACYEIPAYGTNAAARAAVGRGRSFTGFKSCDRCGNIRYASPIHPAAEPRFPDGEPPAANTPPAVASAPPPRKCRKCSGKGVIYVKCQTCGGTRYVHVLTDRGRLGVYGWKNYDHQGRHKTRLSNCPRCSGDPIRAGKVESACPACGGSGYAPAR